MSGAPHDSWCDCAHCKGPERIRELEARAVAAEKRAAEAKLGHSVTRGEGLLRWMVHCCDASSAEFLRGYAARAESAEALIREAREVIEILFGRFSKPSLPKGNAPGHAHSHPPLWDWDNVTGDLRYRECEWCARDWPKSVALLAKLAAREGT